MNNNWTSFGAEETNPFNDLEFVSKLQLKTKDISSNNPFDDSFFQGEDVLSPSLSSSNFAREEPGRK